MGETKADKMNAMRTFLISFSVNFLMWCLRIGVLGGVERGSGAPRVYGAGGESLP